MQPNDQHQGARSIQKEGDGLRRTREDEEDALLPDPTDEDVLYFRPTVPHRKINQTITSFYS